jgi:hypothetical protein
MARLRIDLPETCFRKLAEIAVRQRREIPGQAEILLMRALADIDTSTLRPEPLDREPVNAEGVGL